MPFLAGGVLVGVHDNSVPEGYEKTATVGMVLPEGQVLLCTHARELTGGQAYNINVEEDYVGRPFAKFRGPRAEELDNTDLVLARGRFTGHVHRVYDITTRELVPIVGIASFDPWCEKVAPTRFEPVVIFGGKSGTAECLWDLHRDEVFDDANERRHYNMVRLIPARGGRTSTVFGDSGGQACLRRPGGLLLLGFVVMNEDEDVGTWIAPAHHHDSGVTTRDVLRLDVVSWEPTTEARARAKELFIEQQQQA